MTYAVYTLTFRDGSVYVGSSRDPKRRFENHTNRFRRKAHTATLQSLYDSHGAPTVQVVANTDALDELHILEAEWIAATPAAVNTELPLPHEPSQGDSFGPHASKAEAARALGCSYKTLKVKSRTLGYEDFVAWLHAPKGKQAQCTHPPDPRKNSTLINFGSGWQRRADVCVVPASRAKKRRKLGWSYEASFTTPVGLKPRTPTPERKPKVKARLITVNGVTKPLSAWAKTLGVEVGVIHSRLNTGWSEQDAVTVPKRVQTETADKQPRKRREYTVQGFTGTISEIARHFNVPDARLRSRLRTGWPDHLMLVGPYE
jgi:hypothetical protein